MGDIRGLDQEALKKETELAAKDPRNAAMLILMRDQEIERLRARLAEREGQDTAPPPAPSVPDGWKLVPFSPTEEMLEAAKEESGDHGSWEDWMYFEAAEVVSVYQAMLTATPAPPTTKQAAHPEWRDHVPSVTTDTAGNAAPPRAESVAKAEALEEFATWLMKQPGVAANQMSIYQWLCDEAARLRSEGRE